MNVFDKIFNSLSLTLFGGFFKVLFLPLYFNLQLMYIESNKLILLHEN